MYKFSIEPPKKIEYSPLEKAMEMVSIAAIIFSVAYIITKYPLLPDMIATHFDFSGNITRSASKSTIFLFCGIGIFMYALLTVFRFFPKTWNTVSYRTLNENNIEKVYKISAELLTVIKASILILFDVVQILIIQMGVTNQNNVLVPTLAMTAVIIFIAIFYTVRIFKASAEK